MKSRIARIVDQVDANDAVWMTFDVDNGNLRGQAIRVSRLFLRQTNQTKP